jgi:DNA-binding NarL/FixJ family response regulator
VRVPVRVLLAEDQAAFAQGLTILLGRDPRIEVVGTARDGGEAVDLALAHAADVVLMDLTLPRVDGLEATRRLGVASPRARVVVLSASTRDEAEAAALAAGAAAFVTKSAEYDAIVDAILEVAPE